MTCGRLISTGLATSVILAVVVLPTHPARAAAPARINQLVDKANLSERDRDDIRRYALHWAGNWDPDKVDEARVKLIEPLRAIRVGDRFRIEYSKVVVPLLEKVILNGSAHATVNSLQVVAFLGTPDALKVILAHASIDDEDDYSIRLWAALAFPIAVSQGVLPQNKINEALRKLEKAASHEATAPGPANTPMPWLVLQRQFEAIASVENSVSREVLPKVLKAVTLAMESQQGPSDLMHATYPALILILNEYLTLDQANQQRVGKSLAPVLCDLCTVAAKHWGNAQGDKAARKSYDGAVHVSENLLKLIDARVRPNQKRPRTELGPAWRSGDKNRFVEDHNKWRDVLLGPPYVSTR